MAPRTHEQTKRESGKKRLVLLDSHAILHRAYHAIPDLASSKGEPTGALYGLASMLIKLSEELKPDYIVAARDLPGKTHRHDVYEEYKGTRAEADQELIVQLQKAPEVFTAFGIPVLSAPGFEADDVIGTLVKQAEQRDDVEVIIATGDMDTLQLVSEKTSVYTLRKGFNDTILYDGDRVRERYGFGPENVVDYKALRGDPSDNIKGIKGIGEKGASELIEKFGSIEDIYNALEKHEAAFAKEVKPRMLELLKGGKDDAIFSKQLATIHTAAPVSFELPDHPWKLADHIVGIEKLCDEFEFRSLKERARGLISKQAAKQGKERQVNNTQALFEVAQPEVDPKELEEAALALWLLKSDYTVPGLEEIAQYAGTEEFARAKERIFGDLKKTGRLQEVYDRIEHPLLAVVKHMNETGVALDTKYLQGLAREYQKELAAIAASIFRHAGREFNINSPKQLGDVLYDELKIGSGKQKKTATGARTTREDELLKLADEHPIVSEVLGYRELSKLLGTYVEKLPDLVAADGRLHATFLQTGTVTGRMGCENPNLQNIPTKTDYGRRIRSAFVAPKGNILVSIDYSQIELRIAAGLSGDAKLCESFRTGADIHATVASQVFGVPLDKVDKEMRRKAKVINFGILYGMGVNALRENLGSGTTREEAAAYLEGYFQRFSGLAAYVEDVKASATKLGFTETLFGRRRYLPGLRSKLPQMKSQAERMAVNAPIQGTQADIIKLAMVEAEALIAEKHLDAKLLMQVHDELVYEVGLDGAEETANQIRHVMEGVAPVAKLNNVPVLAEIAIGKDWGEMKHVPR
jgi:DNA polymerase-1